MMDFRETVEKDIREVFHNLREFAETHRVTYNGVEYEVPAVITKYIPEEFEITGGSMDGSGRYGDGIYSLKKTVYIPYEALGVLPEVRNRIFIDDDEYDILSSELIQGKEIVLSLERFAE